MKRDEIARIIDHTLLAPDATADDICRLVAEARQHRFGAVCVNPVWVKLVADELEGLDERAVAIACVVGFPLGACHPETKRVETEQAIRDGATEIDMVMSIGRFKSGDVDLVKHEIESVVAAADRRCVKVILETACLDTAEIDAAGALALDAGASFLKTSTGFGPGGATVEVVRQLAGIAGRAAGVKASGGIRSAADARQMVDAGATRLGSSSGVAIVAAW